MHQTNRPPESIDAVLGWRPNPGPQTRALSIDIPELLYGGARGGGKTDAGIAWIGQPCCCPNPHPRYRGLVLRKNAKYLSDWIERATMRFAQYGGRRVDQKGTTVFLFPGGGRIFTGHLDGPNAYECYQGQEYHRIVIEELTQIPAVDLYLKIMSSCRSSIAELRPALFLTTNPGGPGHSWVKSRFVDPSPEGVAFRDEKTGLYRIFIQSLVDDNPVLAKSDPQYIAFLESLPEHIRRAWRYGDWDAFEGQYFIEWDRKIHVCKAFQPPDWWRKYRSIDWGYWPNPWACGWYAVDDKGHEIKYRECRGHRMTPAEVARKIVELSKADGKNFGPTVADPSMWSNKDGASTAEKFAIAGLPLVQANNDRIQGWTRVHEYLAINEESGRPWLQIAENCLETIRTLPMLIHDDSRVEDVRKDDALDHHPDETRYHLMRRPSRGVPPEKPLPWNSLENLTRLSKINN